MNDLVTYHNDIIDINNNVKDLINEMPEHKDMLVEIKNNLPEINRASSLFGKRQSQFMDNMMTVSHPTPIRNLRQILAEIEKTSLAIKETHFKNKKKEIEIQIKLRDLEEEKDLLKKELISIEIDEFRTHLESSKIYLSGAIRKITNYMLQYNSIKENIMKEQGVEHFNEIDFEQEEERYHIMTAFEQALSAARSRKGTIDEGNLIYFQKIGINGTVAQKYVTDYLNYEASLFQEKKAPTHRMILSFLNDMANIFKGCSSQYAEYKGMTTSSEIALLKKGRDSQ